MCPPPQKKRGILMMLTSEYHYFKIAMFNLLNSKFLSLNMMNTPFEFKKYMFAGNLAIQNKWVNDLEIEIPKPFFPEIMRCASLFPSPRAAEIVPKEKKIWIQS